MVDPVLAAAGSAASSAAGTGAEETGRLLQRALGPTADVFGDWLATQVEHRLKNIGQIAKAATRRGADGSPISPRVANKILEEGSFVDNILSAEYFGGVLAASRGANDSGVVWASLLGQMSSAQIRAHFVLYRELHQVARGLPRGVGNLIDGAQCFVDLDEAVAVLGSSTYSDDPVIVFQHAVSGLDRAGLIQHLAWKANDRGKMPGTPYPRALTFRPTPPGIELYGWSQGRSHLTAVTLREHDVEPFDVDPPTPRLTSAVFPQLAKERAEWNSPERE